MNILVADSSVLIDLERSGLFEVAFATGLVFVVPAVLYHRELESANGPYLRQLGLGITDLSGSEVAEAQNVLAEVPGLSIPDCFALVCASRPDHELLAGDQRLRRAAEARALVVHGYLWLLDELERRGVSEEVLLAGLLLVRDHQKTRLPKAEVQARIDRWSHAE